MASIDGVRGVVEWRGEMCGENWRFCWRNGEQQIGGRVFGSCRYVAGLGWSTNRGVPARRLILCDGVRSCAAHSLRSRSAAALAKSWPLNFHRRDPDAL